MSADNFLDQLQADVFGRIAGDELFSDILILQEDDGITESEVEKALGANRVAAGKKPGLIVIVAEAERDVYSESPGPLYDLTLRVRLIEVPKINRAPGGTQKRRRKVSLKIDQLTHQWCIGGGCVKADKITRYNDGEGGIGYDHLVVWRAGQTKPSQCNPPTISGTAAAVTITSNESGATLYYTTDGSLPYAGNAEASTYSTPFATTAGNVVRAAAFKTGKQSSDVPQLTIPA